MSMARQCSVVAAGRHPSPADRAPPPPASSSQLQQDGLLITFPHTAAAAARSRHRALAGHPSKGWMIILNWLYIPHFHPQHHGLGQDRMLHHAEISINFKWEQLLFWSQLYSMPRFENLFILPMNNVSIPTWFDGNLTKCIQFQCWIQGAWPHVLTWHSGGGVMQLFHTVIQAQQSVICREVQ